MSHFVLIHNPIKPRTAFETSYLDADPVNIGQGPRCATCGGPTGPLRWLPPYRVELRTWGRAFGDIAFGPSIDLLVSERFVLLWREFGLVGLTGFDPVEVVKVVSRPRLKAEPPRYFRVDVARSQAAIDDAASGIVREGGPVCPDCRLGGIINGVRGIVLEPDPPFVEDIAIVRGLPGTFVASERFERFCRQNDIRNAILVPAADCTKTYGLE